MVAAPPKKIVFLLSAVLIIATLGTYQSLKDNDFVNYDDDGAIFTNRHVQQGLSWDSIQWAFTTTELAYWRPLTWVSYMIDCELFGLWPAMFHLHNLLLHLANTLLLFLILNWSTRRVWLSAVVALIFALHPLQVESVAWATERKDVLSGLFWMLTMAAYVWYTLRPGISRYLLVSGCLVLGLMTKPILIMLPWALLLFDVWPLRRIRLGSSTEGSASSMRRLGVVIGEKVPLFILSFLPGAVIYYTAPIFKPRPEDASFFMHLINIPTLYLTYLGKIFWPQPLAVLETFHPITSLGLALLAMVPLALITALGLWQCGRRPHLLVGWLWYLGTIVPGLPLVWIGNNAWTYRINYLPAIGIYLAVVFGLGELVSGYKKGLLGGVLVGALALVMACATTKQIGYWKDNDTFFTYNLSIDPEHPVAHNNYALTLYNHGCYEEAIWHFRYATQVKTHFITSAPLNLIQSYLSTNVFKEHLDEIRPLLRDVFLFAPENGTAYYLLGLVYREEGNDAMALGCLEEALYLQPNQSEAWYDWGILLEKQGDTEGAIEKWRTALWLNPTYAMARFRLGLALMRGNQKEEASDQQPAP